MKKISVVLLGFGLMVLSLFVVVPKALAATKGIQISPLTFNLDVPESGTNGGKIIITNLNAETLSYAVEVENFAGVSEQGGVSFSGKEEDASVTSLKDWFTFDSPLTGEIPANKDQTINFTVAIPVGAEPGGHYAAIFAREIKKTATGQTVMGVASRVGALVLVSVPGDVTKTVQIDELTYPKFVWRGPTDLRMLVQNTGTVHYDSPGTVELKNMLGRTSTVDMGTHTLIPKSPRLYIGNWATKYPIGRYTVTAKALDGDKQAVTKTAVIWALPLIIVIPALIILILLIIIIKYIRKHYQFRA